MTTAQDVTHDPTPSPKATTTTEGDLCSAYSEKNLFFIHKSLL